MEEAKGAKDGLSGETGENEGAETSKEDGCLGNVGICRLGKMELEGVGEK